VPDPIYPAIPEPTQETESLYNTVQRLKEVVEMLAGQRDPQYGVTNLTKTLQKQVGFVTAKFTQEIKVQADELSALSSQVTTVEATANGATAFGEVYLLAEAAPGGYTAQYGWTLTAGDVSLGMKAVTDGVTGIINFYANQFYLTDPSYLGGAPVQVLGYNGTRFNFGVDVTIRNQEIGANAVSQSGVSTGPAGASVTITARGTGGVLLQALAEGDTTYTTSGIGGILELYRGATLLKQVNLSMAKDTRYTVSSGLVTGSFIEYAIMATPSVFLDTPGAGSVTYTASVTNSAGITQVSLIVTELSR
jgi:hypothetical protein